MHLIHYMVLWMVGFASTRRALRYLGPERAIIRIPEAGVMDST
jgi:hypothetical protein